MKSNKPATKKAATKKPATKKAATKKTSSSPATTQPAATAPAPSPVPVQQPAPQLPQPQRSTRQPTQNNSDRKAVAIAALGAMIVLLVLGILGFWGYNTYQNKVEAAEIAATEAAEAEIAAAAEAAAIAAEIEARKEPSQPPYTSRREPPTIVKVDEFTIQDQNGDSLLIGLPIISGHGQRGVYLGSAPPASEIRFAHDSKWVSGGRPISKWHRVQVAHWDPDGRRYVPITGMPLIKRSLPNGDVSYQKYVWAMVMPGS